jgi:hypothetical protein
MNLTKIILFLLVVQSLGCAASLPRRDLEKERRIRIRDTGSGLTIDLLR